LDLRQELPFLVRNYKHLKEFDLILVTGSNQFLDNFGGVWGFPYTLLKWVSMAKMAGTNVALVSLGAGPLTSPFSKLFAKATVRLSDYVSYRDAPSRDLVEGPSNAHKSHVYPDLASNLELREAPEPIAVVEGKIIGINPMPMYDCRYWCDPDDRRYSEYVGKLASAVIALNKSGHHCFLYNTQEQDKLVIDDVIKRIDDITGTEDTARVERKESDTTTGLIHVIRSADISVTTRFHGAVLSLRCGVPVVGICYHRKIADLLDNMEQGEYKLDLDVFDAGLLVEKVNRLIANGQEQKELIQKNSERNRELVEKQYRLLARLFPAQSVNDQF
jgi:polysaccharide pyruvyl transferase WcaK-like protein